MKKPEEQRAELKKSIYRAKGQIEKQTENLKECGPGTWGILHKAFICKSNLVRLFRPADMRFKYRVTLILQPFLPLPAYLTVIEHCHANLMVIKDEERQQATILAGELEKVKGEYDYCIIDCPPDINISVINALIFLPSHAKPPNTHAQTPCNPLRPRNVGNTV